MCVCSVMYECRWVGVYREGECMCNVDSVGGEGTEKDLGSIIVFSEINLVQ